MPIYTRHIQGASINLPWADDHKGLTAIVDESDEDGVHILAFCYHSEDAERIKALLVYGEKPIEDDQAVTNGN